MKLIIDIPDKAYKDEKMALHFGCYSTVLHDTLYNGTPIPDNATNGDVIKIIFPKIGVYDEWYDEPYRKGGKNGVN